MADFVTIVPRCSTYYFSEATNNGLNVLDQASYNDQILFFQDPTWYTHKSLITDIVTIQVHINQGYNVVLNVCDVYKNIITGIDLTVAPYKKGLYHLTGNDYYNPFNGTTTPLSTSTWSFTFNDFIGSVTPNTPLSYYYLRLDVEDLSGNHQILFSEAIFLRQQRTDRNGKNLELKNTNLFTSSYNANRSENTNVVISGWYNNWPTNTIPYTPIFSTRCEAYVLPFDPKAVNIGYLIQNYQQNFITGQQKPTRILKLGENSLGISDYTLQMITEFVLADMWYINGFCYILSSGSSSTSPSELWKSKRDDNRPLLTASTAIEPRFLAQSAMVSPTLSPSSRIHTAVHSLTHI